MSTPAADALLRAMLNQSLYVDSVANAASLRRVDVDSLVWLHLSGESTPGELGAALGLSSGGTSGVLDRLEREGLVERGDDAEDRRRVLIRLTDGGRRLVMESFEPLLAAIDGRLSPAERAEVDGIWQAIESAVTAVRAAVPERAEPDASGDIEGDYAVALAGRRQCTAEFIARFGTVRITALEAGDGRLFQARLASGARVRVTDDAVTFLGRRSPIGPAPDGTIALNPGVPWSFRIPGGAMTVEGDFAGVAIETIEISGGSNELTLAMGTSPGTLRIGGGANQIELRVAGDTPVSLVSRGGTTRIDGGGESRRIMGRGQWELPGSGSGEPLEILIRGGASSLVIVRG